MREVFSRSFCCEVGGLSMLVVTVGLAICMDHWEVFEVDAQFQAKNLGSSFCAVSFVVPGSGGMTLVKAVVATSID